MKIHRPSATTIRSLIGVAVLGLLAAACTTATPRPVVQSALVDQSAAIVFAVVRVVPDQAAAVAAVGIKERPAQAAAITAAAIAAAPHQASAIVSAAIAEEPRQAATIRAAALAVEIGDSVAALPREVFTGRLEPHSSDGWNEFLGRERTTVK